MSELDLRNPIEERYCHMCGKPFREYRDETNTYCPGCRTGDGSTGVDLK